MDRFIAADLKFERAKKHIADLEKLLTPLPKIYTPSIEINEETGTEKLCYRPPNIDEVSSTTAIILGDAVHNLRVAIEYAYLGAVERLANASFNPDHTRIPFKKTRIRVEEALRTRKIDTACPELFEFVLREIQPYKESGNFFFEALHALDIRDKHDLLVPTEHLAWIRDIIVENEKGELINASTWAIKGRGPYFLDIPRGCKIKDKGQLSATIAFDHIKLLKGTPIIQGLNDFSNFIRYLIDRLRTL
jgi:hypothetical protein